MYWRTLVGSTAVALAAATLGLIPSSQAAPPTGAAPGGPGDQATWTEANKTGFGTARTRGSNVWFTLQQGRTSEVFYPDLSTPSVRSLELVVTGDGFTDRESTDMRHRTIRPDARSLTFRQVDTDRQGRYRIVETFVTDPRRDALDVRIRLVSLDGAAYRLYALYDPSLANTGMDDSGSTDGGVLTASDGGTPVATALESLPAFDETSTGYLGTSDGWTDLKSDQTLDATYDSAGPGNIVQVGRIAGVTGQGDHQRARLTLGFGQDVGEARATADGSLGTPFGSTARRYAHGWHSWLRSIKHVPPAAAGVRRQYLASAMIVAAAEDKLNPGAFVASPSSPWAWGDELPDLASPSGAYHLVWSRDAYQFGTALWAMGDRAAARRIVDWLFTVQQKDDGSFPQNSDVTGTPVWTNLQLDEVALPIVLAHLVGRDDAATYAHVKKAADFIADYSSRPRARRSEKAPFSPQERWENQSGYSPNSIAAQINGLVCAAHMATRNGDVALREALAHPGRPVAAPREEVDRDQERAAQREALLPAADQGRRPERRHDLRHRGRRADLDRPASRRRSELPRPRALRHPRSDRPRHPLLAPGDRPPARRADPERPVLAARQLRRVRRDADRPGVDDHRLRDLHHARPRVADPHRRAR